MVNNFNSYAGVNVAPEYRNVRGHIEVYIDGKFFCSADSRREADEEFYNEFGGGDLDDETSGRCIKNIRRNIKYGN